jgi:hypothetical protein
VLNRRLFVASALGTLPRISAQTLGTPFRSERGWTPLLSGKDLSGWKVELGWRGVPGRTNEWLTTQSVGLSADAARLDAKREPGGILVNGIETHTTNLITERTFGDLELYIEFMVAKNSNSGVYLHGLYEVQVFDSFGSAKPLTFSDGGGIYQRFENGKGFGGYPPRSNACRAPGVWQFYHIRFRAPRFDSAGKKTGDARFERIVYNGTTIHEDVACDGPTRSSLEIPEAARNPIMLQGDHGPVAYRNIYFRALAK